MSAEGHLHHQVSRRAFLAGMGATALTTFAGCSEVPDSFPNLGQGGGESLEPGQPRVTIPWLEDNVRRWTPQMELLGALYKLDPNLIATIITKESHGSPKATSGEAHGLMQITPDTAKGIASNYLNTALSTGDIWAPQPT